MDSKAMLHRDKLSKLSSASIMLAQYLTLELLNTLTTLEQLNCISLYQNVVKRLVYQNKSGLE